MTQNPSAVICVDNVLQDRRSKNRAQKDANDKDFRTIRLEMSFKYHIKFYVFVPLVATASNYWH